MPMFASFPWSLELASWSLYLLGCILPRTINVCSQERGLSGCTKLFAFVSVRRRGSMHVRPHTEFAFWFSLLRIYYVLGPRQLKGCCCCCCYSLKFFKRFLMRPWVMKLCSSPPTGQTFRCSFWNHRTDSHHCLPSFCDLPLSSGQSPNFWTWHTKFSCSISAYIFQLISQNYVESLSWLDCCTPAALLGLISLPSHQP